LRSTAEAHRRVMVLVMGCHAGWIATHAGVAALDLASAGRWGMMAPLRGAEVATMPVDKATSQIKTVPDSSYQMAEVVSG
jgi:6-phosphofructokinase